MHVVGSSTARESYRNYPPQPLARPCASDSTESASVGGAFFGETTAGASYVSRPSTPSTRAAGVGSLGLVREGRSRTARRLAPPGVREGPDSLLMPPHQEGEKEAEGAAWQALVAAHPGGEMLYEPAKLPLCQTRYIFPSLDLLKPARLFGWRGLSCR
eukprot:SAG11_NODE_4926_length_1720_cov_1.428748_2_plen_158_part_00